MGGARFTILLNGYLEVPLVYTTKLYHNEGEKMRIVQIITLAVSLLFISITASETIINKGTKYEARISSKGEHLYLDFKGKKKKLLVEESNLRFRIDDINFDGVDDIAVVEMTGYSGVNLYYKVFFAKNGNYIEDKNLSISNYELYPQYKTILSEYKSGPRHFTDLYDVNYKNRIKKFVTYENYEEANLCFIEEIDIEESIVKPKSNGILSCKSLLEKHVAVPLFAKVITKKAVLFANIDSDQSNGMYLIKGDMVELIDGEATMLKLLIRYKGKRAVTKYIDKDNIEIIPLRQYKNIHTIRFYSNKKWVKEETSDVLSIQEIAREQSSFVLSTIGTNAHSCDMKGILKEYKTHYLYQGEKGCELKLIKTKSGIKTVDKNMKCKEYNCGMRAFVGGLNFKLLENSKQK